MSMRFATDYSAAHGVSAGRGMKKVVRCVSNIKDTCCEKIHTNNDVDAEVFSHHTWEQSDFPASKGRMG
jgi:hypothetical protein